MGIGKKNRVNSSQIKNKDFVFIKKSNSGGYENKFISLDEFNKVIKKSNKSGDKHYTYEQESPVQVWIINHRLNKEPSVIIEDVNGDIVEAFVKIVDLNSIRIEFSKPFIGKAHMN